MSTAPRLAFVTYHGQVFTIRTVRAITHAAIAAVGAGAVAFAAEQLADAEKWLADGKPGYSPAELARLVARRRDAYELARGRHHRAIPVFCSWHSSEALAQKESEHRRAGGDHKVADFYMDTVVVPVEYPEEKTGT